MNAKLLGGQPAFPADARDCGLTKREWLAGLAMEGLRASQLHHGAKGDGDIKIWSNEEVACQAALDADALLRMLAKEQA